MSTDPLIARFRELSDEMTAAQAAVSRVTRQRRRILLELRATGMNMQQLADAVGLTRTRVYRIIGEIPDPRKGPPTAETDAATAILEHSDRVWDAVANAEPDENGNVTFRRAGTPPGG